MCLTSERGSRALSEGRGKLYGGVFYSRADLSP
jgi:hypothetical protein